MQFSAEIL